MKIVAGVSHVDHGLTSDHIAFVSAMVAIEVERKALALTGGVRVLGLTLPGDLAGLDCGLHGPAMGDNPIAETEVTYEVRANRKNASRMVSRATRKTREIVVVVGPIDDEPCTLYTSYGGPLAPREPGDQSIGSWDDLEVSRAFWRDHALSI